MEPPDRDLADDTLPSVAVAFARAGELMERKAGTGELWKPEEVAVVVTCGMYWSMRVIQLKAELKALQQKVEGCPRCSESVAKAAKQGHDPGDEGSEMA